MKVYVIQTISGNYDDGYETEPVDTHFLRSDAETALSERDDSCEIIEVDLPLYKLAYYVLDEQQLNKAQLIMERLQAVEKKEAELNEAQEILDQKLKAAKWEVNYANSKARSERDRAVSMNEELQNLRSANASLKKELREHQKGKRFIGFRDSSGYLWRPSDDNPGRYVCGNSVATVAELKAANHNPAPEYEEL